MSRCVLRMMPGGSESGKLASSPAVVSWTSQRMNGKLPSTCMSSMGSGSGTPMPRRRSTSLTMSGS